MASAAFDEFRYNVLDAKRLHQAHGIVSAGTPGKKGLGHLTRSGVVMLCAAWERYNESVIVEAAGYLARAISAPNNLPLSVRKHLSAIAKKHAHELKPMELAGEGWRTLYVAQATDEISSLNTPKSGNLKVLYERFVGLSDVSVFWSIGAKPVDDFVSTRGDIAHNGRKAPYINTAVLLDYISMIENVAAEHDNKFCDYLREVSGTQYQPWRRTA